MYKIIDNYAPKDLLVHFKETLFSEQFPWYFHDYVASIQVSLNFVIPKTNRTECGTFCTSKITDRSIKPSTFVCITRCFIIVFTACVATRGGYKSRTGIGIGIRKYPTSESIHTSFVVSGFGACYIVFTYTWVWNSIICIWRNFTPSESFTMISANIAVSCVRTI